MKAWLGWSIALAWLVGFPATGAEPSLVFPQMLPGQYQETMELIEISANAPPEMVARVQAGEAKSIEICYRRDVHDPAARSLIEQRGYPGCKALAAQVSGNRTQGKFECSENNFKGLMTYEGIFTETSADLDLVASIKDKRYAQPMTVKTKLTLRRIAETCPGS